MLNSANETFQSGDKVFVYNGKLIGFYSPSNGRNTPNGLSAGKQQSVEEVTTNFELCGDNLENYPVVPPVVTGPPIENPELPTEDPELPTEDPSDRTPECILNTSSDYAAIETSTGKYFFNSTSFGLNNYNSLRWYYVPEDYDPNNPSSYIYFDKSEQTGEPRVSGPNPNYSYSQICRVRKMEL